MSPNRAIAWASADPDIGAVLIDHATAIDREAGRILKAPSTEDHREAVRAFAEKRDAVFSGTGTP